MPTIDDDEPVYYEDTGMWSASFKVRDVPQKFYTLFNRYAPIAADMIKKSVLLKDEQIVEIRDRIATGDDLKITYYSEMTEESVEIDQAITIKYDPYGDYDHTTLLVSFYCKLANPGEPPIGKIDELKRIVLEWLNSDINKIGESAATKANVNVFRKKLNRDTENIVHQFLVGKGKTRTNRKKVKKTKKRKTQKRRH